jgi:hypothetical protein
VLPDGGGDLVHITTYNVKRPGHLPGLPVHVTRGRTLRLSDPDGWPLTWRCEECRNTIAQLTRDQARHAGRVKRIILARLASDN